ncbi:MAG: Crp/Fnr family transcriptional regulator [Solobacterium sp.]|nr:Crp/Fnr family transcriptional regulator [Solobacterium sp.]
MTISHLDLIRKAHIFRGVPAAEFTTMLESLDSQLKSYRSGQIVIPAGRRVRRAGLLLEGSVTVYRTDFWSEKHFLETIRPGSIFLESFACAEKRVTNIFVRADIPSVILWFNIQDILRLDDSCDYHSILVRNLMNEISAKNIDLNAKIVHMSQHTTKEKLLSYLSEESIRQNSSEFDIPFDRQQLADYLSVERSAMAAVLSSLVKDGYLKTKKNHFILLPGPGDSQE